MVWKVALLVRKNEVWVPPTVVASRKNLRLPRLVAFWSDLPNAKDTITITLLVFNVGVIVAVMPVSANVDDDVLV